ncbi:glutathione hydrolase 1 proenzyme isoform X2 [Anopheles gambiae]|uniref:Gamma-glutamyltransferase n=2 Tax=Anopheles coluzzii TaxID=1518534 RepID=A0A6E8VEA1_ANOCL|nr:glutathione hydrolase 1 proenzyme-like isoform X1 [Anopheles coluzzii]XP_316824.6 glutathione hydrolase 1 proenzyme isoform X2 [Anopheles gambiae]
MPNPARDNRCRTLTLYFHIPLAAVLLYWYRPYLFDQFTVGTTQAPPPPPHHATSDALVPPDPGHTDLSVKLSYSTLHMYETAAICSDSDICSNIGRDLLKRNGSAVDAAIGTMFCAGLTNLQSMGLGGGFVMNVYRRAERRAYTLDAREIAAGQATEDMHLHDPSTTNEGPLSVAVPGELKGYWEAHRRFGQLPWAEVVRPSRELCRRGIPISKHMQDSLSFNSKALLDERIRDLFTDPATGRRKVQGDLIQPTQLCDTLDHIATEGGDTLYQGPLAEEFAADLKDMGSIITLEDLRSYRVRWNESIPIELNGDTMYVAPPPASGVLLAFIMNILKGYHFQPDDVHSIEETILTVHRIVEAFKFAYGKRTEIGDPLFVDIAELTSNLTSIEYAEAIRARIDEMKTGTKPGDYDGYFFTPNNEGTAHISVLAPSGDAVSVTSSVNFYFGAGLMGPRTGIIVNSGMDDFSSPGLRNYFGLPGSKANFIRPRKRALSSMSPTIVTDPDHEVKLVVGAAGGTKITTAVALTIMRVLWFGYDIKEAIDAPRFHHQLIPMAVQYEYGNLDLIVKGLRAKGHHTMRYRERGSIICAIAQNASGIYANADFRKGGDVAGF